MKGPSLQYNIQVMRVFCCDGCGRQVQAPGKTTSHTCACSTPPRFMRPLERPRVQCPDITAFLSPPDPADEAPEEVPDEEPYIPYIPQLPPKPVRFPGRRKLSDDIEKFQPAEFGAGVDSPTGSGAAADVASEPIERTEAAPSATSPRRGNRSERTERPERNDRHESRRERGRSGRGQGRVVDREPDRGAAIPADDPVVTPRSVLPAVPMENSSAGPIDSLEFSDIHENDLDSEVADSDQSPAEGASGEARRRHRRRGRRRRRGTGPASGSAES